MSLDLQQELQQAHALLDRLPPANDDDEVTEPDRAAIQAGLDSLNRNG